MTERLFSFYGDDFTGSTDALEALAANGVPSVLFLEPPGPELLGRFRECRAMGIAGESRSRSPQWMSENLPDVFASLKAYGAPVTQYKVCSTFDSSPQVGSIGRALEIGQEVFGTAWVPVVVGAPHLRRYVLFGNLFAAGGGEIHRIDRHPTMRQHPVTPMHESDLRLHLQPQFTSGFESAVGLLDILAMQSKEPEEALAALIGSGARAVVFDGLDESSLEVAGRLLWTVRPGAQSFAVGSSGLTHALIRHWRKAGMIAGQFTPERAKGVDRLMVVSGSCSPVTEAQIQFALANGFEGLRIDPSDLDWEETVKRAESVAAGGRSMVLYTALGPQDCAGGEGGERLGRALGEMLREVLRRTGIGRVLIAGGDTSTHAVRQLGVDALTFAAMTTPGAPLCRCHSEARAIDGLEIVLKGGQVGPPEYFVRVWKGMS